MTELVVAPPASAGGIELLALLEREGKITETGLVLDDPDLSFEDWEALGRYLGVMGSRLRFYLGDWLNFGSSGVYGERYAQAMDATGLAYETLTNYASVCRKVARSRRRKNLSFSHHALVAKLDPRVQDEWLEASDANGWKRSELAERLQEAAAPPELPPPAPTALSGRQTANAARALSTVQATLELAETAARSTGDATLVAEIPKALRELDTAAEVFLAALALPNLNDVVTRLLADARTSDDDPTFSIVSTRIVDELRKLVLIEGSTE